ncbi:SOS response transcriptional repressor [Burkholderia cenocepacia]|uniref:SOS response transcriptional repressor n=2 Tax=Burkholderia cenocepacia TaxID=95486 RepID=A0A6B2MGP4_9BURK|nr:SOS response transcriptional repressor [Burkholderia cenocepacia]
MIDAPGKHISGVNGPTGIGQESGLIERLVSDSGTNIAKSPKKFDKNVEPAPRGQRSIPVISYVQAGMMTEAMDPFALGEGFETVVTDLDVSEGSFWLKIKGISMLPEFPEGDMVLIDPSVTPLPGDFVVAKNTEEEATFKKYRPRGTNDRGEATFELVPLNDDFPTLYSERDHLRVIGVMMEHRKYRRR